MSNSIWSDETNLFTIKSNGVNKYLNRALIFLTDIGSFKISIYQNVHSR